MAFKAYATEEDLKKEQEAASGTGSIIPSSISSGQSAAITPGSSQSSQPGAAPAAAGKGTSWVNLQQYLTANQGAGGQIADKVLGGAQSQITSAVDDINKQAQKGIDAARAGTVQRNQGLESQIKADPLKVKKEEFDAYTNQTYKGPKNLTEVEGYEGVMNKWRSANDMYKNLQTQEGRETALAQSLQDPRYSQGMSYLDGYLMQEEAAPKLAEFNQRNAGLAGSLDGARQTFDKQRAAAEAETQKNIGFAREAAAKAKTGILDQNNAQLSEWNQNSDLLAQAPFATQGLETGIRGGDQRFDKYGIDRAQFYKPASGNYEVGDVLSVDERARLAALAQLLGEEDVYSNAKSSGQTGPEFDEAAYRAEVRRREAELFKKSQVGKNTVTKTTNWDPSSMQWDESRGSLA